MPRNTARKAVIERPEPSLIAGNVKIRDRRTSVRLEPEMWSALREIAEREDVTIHDVCTIVDECKLDGESFSSSLRVFLLKYYRQAARGRKRAALAMASEKEQALWLAARAANEERNRREGQDARSEH